MPNQLGRGESYANEFTYLANRSNSVINSGLYIHYKGQRGYCAYLCEHGNNIIYRSDFNIGTFCRLVNELKKEKHYFKNRTGS